MTSRRAFLSRLGSTGSLVAAALNSDGLSLMARASEQARGRSAVELAADEDFWREIQLGFTLDRTIINLNNGGVCPSPRVVHEAFKRYLDHRQPGARVQHVAGAWSPTSSACATGWRGDAGCDPEELAITRNASEALQIAQLGIDLKPGDEVVTTNQDYGRMLDTWEQRVRRDGIALTKISFPVPPPSHGRPDAAARAARHAEDEGAALLPHHQPDGADLPGGATSAASRARRGIQTIVDGAHAFAHFPFAIRDLGCDYYGTSLHKWLLAPIGTGFLYVRRERIHGPVAADARRRVARPTTSGSSRRSARTRRPTTTRSPRPASSTTPSAASGRSRACATCAIAGCGASRDHPKANDPHELRPGPGRAPSATSASTGHRPRDARRAPLREAPHHRHADQARRVRGPARHAERLHDARRSGHVRDDDRADPGEGLPPRPNWAVGQPLGRPPTGRMAGREPALPATSRPYRPRAALSARRWPARPASSPYPTKR